MPNPQANATLRTSFIITRHAIDRAKQRGYATYDARPELVEAKLRHRIAAAWAAPENHKEVISGKLALVIEAGWWCGYTVKPSATGGLPRVIIATIANGVPEDRRRARQIARQSKRMAKKTRRFKNNRQNRRERPHP